MGTERQWEDSLHTTRHFETLTFFVPCVTFHLKKPKLPKDTLDNMCPGGLRTWPLASLRLSIFTSPHNLSKISYTELFKCWAVS